MELGDKRDLIRIYMLIAGAFSIVFFVRWTITGYLLVGLVGALVCGAVLFIFLLIGAGILYVALERFDTTVLGRRSQQALPMAYYPPQYYYYPQMPYYPPPYGPYYPPMYQPPAGSYYPPPYYQERPPAYPRAPYYPYGFYPQAGPYGQQAPSPQPAAAAQPPAALGPAPPPAAPVQRPPAPPAQPAPGPYPGVPFAPSGPAPPSADDLGNRKPLQLPSASLLLIIFLGAVGVGGLSLALAAATGYLSLLVFPFAFVIGFSFPSLIWISYVYSFEKHAPVTSKAMLVAFTYGMLSTIPALIINTAAAVVLGAYSETASVMAMLLTAALVAPLVEEFSKPWGVFLVSKEVRSRLDGLIFGVTCGVGFALIENITYEFSFLLTGENPAAIWTLGSVARGLGSIMIHATGAGLIGYAYGHYRVVKGSTPAVIVLAYIVGVILHSAWNGVSVLLSEVTYGDALNIAFVPLFAVGAFLLLRYFIGRGAASETEPGGLLPPGMG